jgi:hypothetical protein
MTDITTRLLSMSEAMYMDRSQDEIDALLLEAKGEIERWKTSSEAWKKSHAEMHRRAQKAEGALKAAGIILEGWEKTISHYDLPKHDFIIRTIKAEFSKALARAALIPQQKGNADGEQ